MYLGNFSCLSSRGGRIFQSMHFTKVSSLLFVEKRCHSKFISSFHINSYFEFTLILLHCKKDFEYLIIIKKEHFEIVLLVKVDS